MRRIPSNSVFSELQLVNGSTGDPLLYIDYPGSHDAILFDAGDTTPLTNQQLADLRAVFITHHHVDHFIGIDRIVRYNTDADKVLHLFGPDGTIRKLCDRIRSYEYPFFPFQKIVLRITEIVGDQQRTCVLECAKRFPEPEIVESPWDADQPLFENSEVAIFAAPVDHTVPCLAFSLVEKPGYHVDLTRLQHGPLRPGAWIQELIQYLQADPQSKGTLAIEGGSFPLQTLAQKYLRKSAGCRVAYVVDTAYSDRSKPQLLKLASNADRLYCDCFYLQKHAKQAAKHRHMTAIDAARFACDANVKELVLVHFSQRYQGIWYQLLEEAHTLFPTATAMF